MAHHILLRSFAVLVTATGLTLSGCGRAPSAQDDASDLEWVRSRTNSTQYAFLENRDLNDTFIFGASVIKVDDFISNALNMVVRPTKVTLQTRNTASGRKLDVVTTDRARSTLVSFDTKAVGTKTEIDFGSAGNDVQLRGLIDAVGGVFTASSEKGFWVSTGAPSVLNIQQDDDTMVVDLLHTVRQAIVRTTIFGRTVVERFVSDHPGKVTVRVYLKRQSSLADIGVDRKIKDGKRVNVGYFGTSLASDDANQPIQRFALGDAEDAQPITFYLKDVPAAYKDVAKRAILSWNKAFDDDVIRVADAPGSLDVGDPRFNVVKWFDGLDNDVSWAGVAKMMVEPDTGLVMGGHLFLNGGSVLKMYEGITSFSHRIAEGGLPLLSGSIGNVEFDRDQGERPVVPFLSDLSQDYDGYMKNYYLETIAHEVGHVLGLRHNFRGSIELTDNQSASVMDYAPRAERAHYQGPGRYDIAAIRWGYLGEQPAQTLPFCTDEDIWKLYDCSQGDWGDAVKSSVHGLLDGALTLSKKPVEATSDVLISSLSGALENALKIKKLASQLPASSRAETVAKIDAAHNHLYNVAPDASLPAASKAIVVKNLERLRRLTKKMEDELRASGKL